ncbi:MAG TPA: hypothetical protein VGF27_09640 [Pseudoduganella sp.]
MLFAPGLILAGALAAQTAAAQVLDTSLGFSGLKVQAWSLADGAAVDAGVHFSSAHVYGEILNMRSGESVYDIGSASSSWNPVLAGAATRGSLSGGAVTGMLGDGLLLLHLDRADYPWRYADADMGSVAYIDLAPHSYATVSGDCSSITAAAPAFRTARATFPSTCACPPPAAPAATRIPITRALAPCR